MGSDNDAKPLGIGQDDVIHVGPVTIRRNENDDLLVRVYDDLGVVHDAGRLLDSGDAMKILRFLSRGK